MNEVLVMKKYVLVLSLLAVLAGWGCSAVVSQRPVGEVPVVLNPEEWEGAWIAPEGGGPVVIRVEDGKKGYLKLAWIEDDRNMTFKSLRVVILRSGTWDFANIREEDEKGGTGQNYFFARVKKEKNRILVWLPRAEKFAALVEGKILPGRAAKETVTLGELKPEHTKIIASEEKGLLFDWENPVILMKTGQ